MNSAATVLTAENLSKRFGPLRALERVNLSLNAGEVHAILGENGAGKSTLLNILAGFLAPDSGAVSILGNSVAHGNPQEIRRRGVAMVHQHFMLVPNFTVAENLALDSLETLSGKLATASLTAKARAIAESLEWELDFERRTAELPVGVRQRIEILKALSREPTILFLDEPTAVLSEAEIQDLFRVIRELKGRGVAIALIAHKLSEIMQIADRVTVLRQGEVVGAGELKDLSQKQIEHWMLGEAPILNTMHPTPSNEIAFRAANLAIRGDWGGWAIQDLSLEVRRGEILGIGGVDGNGQTELAETIAGIRRYSGTLESAGEVGFIPPDRQRDGVALEMSVTDNLLITGHRLPELKQGLFLSSKATRQWAAQLIERFNIKCESGKDLVRGLSGGNRQKIVVARALDLKPTVLVAVNPTRGLDFGAARFVHESLQQAAMSGMAIILISTDQDELFEVAHQIRYLHDGRQHDKPLGGAA